MNVGEYGVIFYLDTGFNMSAQTGLKLTFTKPDKSVLTIQAGITVPGAPVTTPLGVFNANEYVKYVFVQGNVDQAGLWSVRLTYDDAGPQHLISNSTTFTVNP